MLPVLEQPVHETVDAHLRRDRYGLVAGPVEGLGADVIQFDEPAFNVFMDEVTDWGIAALERANVGGEEVGHVIMGNAMQTSGDAIYCARHVGLKAGLPVEEVFSLLTQAGSISDESEVLHAQSQPLTRLANYIVEKHHVFTRNEVERLTALLEKVCSVHGANHPELLQIQSQFQKLLAELEPHMMKEERILFHYIVGLEAAAADNHPAPFAPFGTVGNPIAMMMRAYLMG